MRRCSREKGDRGRNQRSMLDTNEGARRCSARDGVLHCNFWPRRPTRRFSTPVRGLITQAAESGETQRTLAYRKDAQPHKRQTRGKRGRGCKPNLFGLSRVPLSLHSCLALILATVPFAHLASAATLGSSGCRWRARYSRSSASSTLRWARVL